MRKPPRIITTKRRSPRPQGELAWEWYQYINRFWMKFLSGSELKVLLMIVDRTLGWQKEWEVITRKQFVDGVVTRESGKIFHSGTALGASTIDGSLKQLEKKGVIFKREVARGNTIFVEFRLNLKWNPDSLEEY